MSDKHTEPDESRQLRQEMLNLLSDFTDQHGFMARREAYYIVPVFHSYTLFGLYEFFSLDQIGDPARENQIGVIFGIPVIIDEEVQFVQLARSE